MKRKEIIGNLVDYLEVPQEEILKVVKTPPILCTITFTNNRISLISNLSDFKIDKEGQEKILINLLEASLATLKGKKETSNGDGDN